MVLVDHSFLSSQPPTSRGRPSWVWFCWRYLPFKREFSCPLPSCACSWRLLESKRRSDAICWFPLLGSCLGIGFNLYLNQYDYYWITMNWNETDSVFEAPWDMTVNKNVLKQHFDLAILSCANIYNYCKSRNTTPANKHSPSKKGECSLNS